MMNNRIEELNEVIDGLENYATVIPDIVELVEKGRRCVLDYHFICNGIIGPDELVEELIRCEKLLGEYKKEMSLFLEKSGYRLSTDYKGRCGNCHELMDESDNFCKYCGTRRGGGSFKPYKNIMTCIYGPQPRKRFHICSKCGNSWETMLMVDNEKFCPICGGNAKTTEV